MKKLNLIVLTIAVLLTAGCSNRFESGLPMEVTFTKEQLTDKIKGGWAGQVIGVTYGAPTEFRYKGMMIPDSVSIEWGDPDYIKGWMEKFPGLYDDIYMDLTFVEVYERLGLDAPVDSMAAAFAHAGYNLWEANQTARYNILNGIMPPESGHWKNNPHADDIDFQIESDFAGLMSPGMPNTAAVFCDSIGHIMNYGDGWYGGVYMSAMYSLAFVCDSVETVVSEALKCIPEQSRYYQCISDVIATYNESPDDWKKAWQRCADYWDKTLCCPTGAYVPYNIDAALNSAYVVIGLLYGHGDFGRTIEIATRCGQDSDCNPASAGGILGTILGYENIPQEWLEPLKVAEDIDFAYTSSSLNDTYKMSFNQALKVIERNGGSVNGDAVTIKCQEPTAVKFEKSFDDLMPFSKNNYWKNITAEGLEIDVNGNGVVISGGVEGDSHNGYIAQIEVRIDGVPADTFMMPADFATRKYNIYWNYDLDGQPHKITLVLLNPNEANTVTVSDVLELKKNVKP